MSDLVKQLRTDNEGCGTRMEKAADAIERKDAAIAELVGVLKRIELFDSLDYSRRATDSQRVYRQIRQMTNEPPYVSDLYDTLENLKHKVETQCPVIPECVQSCLDLAHYVLARVKYERERKC